MKTIPLSIGTWNNQSSGIRGVTWHKGSGKWVARYGGGKKNQRIHLGYFVDIAQAKHALEEFRGKLEPKKMEVLISDEDYEFLSQFKWHKIKGGYAIRNIALGDGKWTIEYMHRDIARRMGLTIDGRQIDHRNRNKLDNQRENLRMSTQSQNVMNSPIRRNNTSSVSGVHFDKSKRKWVARVSVEGKSVFFKRFDTFEEAVEARKRIAKEYYGEFYSG